MNVRNPPSDSSGSLLTLVAAGFAFVLGLYSLHHLYFVVLALLPAAAAALIEPRGHRTAAVAITSLTAATVFPLVLGSMIYGSRRDLLTSGTAWAYVGAAVCGGMAIFVLLPAGAAWREDRRAKRRIGELRRRQKELEEEWGPEIRTTVAA